MLCRITYARIQRTKEIAPGIPLLQAFKTHNVPVAYSCEKADCGTCVVRIDQGADCLSPMSALEDVTLRARGYEGLADPRYRLACQAILEHDGDLTVFNKVPG
ncbi:MAG TPA: 2Fe-2S iron-sulfur cluster-binding protein [bacterium]|nr:2Fe-2S iron-sulfur cluster-binding protein [bacterium]